MLSHAAFPPKESLGAKAAKKDARLRKPSPLKANAAKRRQAASNTSGKIYLQAYNAFQEKFGAQSVNLSTRMP